MASLPTLPPSTTQSHSVPPFLTPLDPTMHRMQPPRATAQPLSSPPSPARPAAAAATLPPPAPPRLASASRIPPAPPPPRYPPTFTLSHFPSPASTPPSLSPREPCSRASPPPAPPHPTPTTPHNTHRKGVPTTSLTQPPRRTVPPYSPHPVPLASDSEGALPPPGSMSFPAPHGPSLAGRLPHCAGDSLSGVVGRRGRLAGTRRLRATAALHATAGG